MWYARKTQNVDGKERLAGEPVPEAATWPNVHRYVACGFIEWRDTAPLTDDSMAAIPPPSGPVSPGSDHSPESLPSIISNALFGKGRRS
jgi:hypothetical protein